MDSASGRVQVDLRTVTSHVRSGGNRTERGFELAQIVRIS